jgi:hypothetical protein
LTQNRLIVVANTRLSNKKADRLDLKSGPTELQNRQVGDDNRFPFGRDGSRHCSHLGARLTRTNLIAGITAITVLTASRPLT